MQIIFHTYWQKFSLTTVEFYSNNLKDIEKMRLKNNLGKAIFSSSRCVQNECVLNTLKKKKKSTLKANKTTPANCFSFLSVICSLKIWFTVCLLIFKKACWHYNNLAYDNLPQDLLWFYYRHASLKSVTWWQTKVISSESPPGPYRILNFMHLIRNTK